MAVTVTATGAGGTPYAFCSLTVLVLTGALEAGGASAALQADPAAASVTPAAANSLVCWAAQNETTGTAFTAAASNASLNSTTDAGTGTGYMQGFFSGTVTSGTPVTAGTSAPSSGTLNFAAYEVTPARTSTPARDGSAPAPVNVASASATTASFTPPGNAVLVALVSTPGGSAGGYALTVSDSGALAWTRRAHIYGGANNGLADVWTATTPPSNATSTPAVTAAGTASPVVAGAVHGAAVAAQATSTPAVSGG